MLQIAVDLCRVGVNKPTLKIKLKTRVVFGVFSLKTSLKLTRVMFGVFSLRR